MSTETNSIDRLTEKFSFTRIGTRSHHRRRRSISRRWTRTSGRSWTIKTRTNRSSQWTSIRWSWPRFVWEKSSFRKPKKRRRIWRYSLLWLHANLSSGGAIPAAIHSSINDQSCWNNSKASFDVSDDESFIDRFVETSSNVSSRGKRWMISSR